jgi:hypothetical protein
LVDREQFLHVCTLINTSLVNQVMDRTYNSVGSNIFLEFGKRKEIVFQNGRQCFQKEWAIWLSWTSWRISRYNKYIIGSGENFKINIQPYLEKLLGKRFRSFRFLSQFLDVEFNFEDGYQISTFFNRITEDQWLIFLPDKTEMIIDCSSEEAIKSIQHLSKQVEIKNKYKEVEYSFFCVEVIEFLFEEMEVSKIICTEGFSIDLRLSAWRLEKNDKYQIGRKDYYFGSIEGQGKEFKNKLLNLTGKKIKSMGIDSSGMDMRLEFEEEYVLEIFTHAQANQWQICRNGEPLFHANTNVFE